MAHTGSTPIPSYFPRRIIAFLVDKERIPFADILAAVGLTSDMVIRQESVLPAELAEKLIRFGLETSIRQGLGFGYGASLNISDLDMLGYAAVSQANVGEAIKLVTEHYPVLTHMSHMHIDDDAPDFLRISCNQGLDKNVERFLSEAICMAVANNIETYIPGARQHMRFYFNYDKPGYHKEYQALNKQTYFNQENSGILFSKELLAMPMHNQASHWPDDFVLPKNDHAYARNFVQQIEHHIRSHLADNISMDKLAELMQTSVRTLQRRLQAESLDFRQMHEKIRIQQAQKLLSSQHTNIKDVAIQVGYSDSASLSRAFKRLTGLTPSAYKKSQQ